MTSVRPEHEYDPLTDPLPQGGHESPWFRSDNPAPEASAPVQEPVSGPAYAPVPESAPEPVAPQEWYGPGPEVPQQDWYAARQPMPGPVSPPTAEIPISEPIAVPEPVADSPAAAPSAVPPATGGRAERRKAA
ncbi:class E sortase, partial [Streptomyces sp. SID1034]|nr:class E sortase [Streptomyces sp. SID1034]